MAFRAIAFSSTLVGAWPTTVTGDALYACVSVDENPSTLSATGWTLISSQTNTFDGQVSAVFWYSGNGGAGAPSSPPASTTWTSSGGAGSPTVVIASFSGRGIGSQVATPKLTTTGTATPFVASMTGVTASAGDDLIVFFAADQTNSNILSLACAGTPGLFSNRGVGGDGFSQVGCSTIDNIAAGATGNIAGTITSAGGSITIGWASFVIGAHSASAPSTASDALFFTSD